MTTFRVGDIVEHDTFARQSVRGRVYRTTRWCLFIKWSETAFSRVRKSEATYLRKVTRSVR